MLDPSDKDALVNIGNIHMQAGHVTEAVEMYHKVNVCRDSCKNSRP